MDFSSILHGLCETLINGLMWFIDNRYLMLIISGSLLLLSHIIDLILKFYSKSHCTNNICYVKNDTSIIFNSSDFDEDDEDDEDDEADSYNTFDEIVLPSKCLNCGAVLINGKCQYCGSIFEIKKE